MMIRLLAFAWICLCTFAAQAQSLLPIATVAYSADRIIESETGTFTGRVYSSFGLERAEMAVGGMQSVMILRADKDVGWMLMPAQRMYQPLEYGKARKQAGSWPADDVSIERMDSEIIGGIAATRYKLLMKDGSAGGFMWFSEDGIPVKMDLLTKEAGRKSRMTMTLVNLATGEQDPALFELPADYSPMPGMSGLPLVGAAPAQPVAEHQEARPESASIDQPDSATPASIAREAARQVLFKLPGLRNR